MSCGDFLGAMNGHPHLTGSPSSLWRKIQAASFCRPRNAAARSRPHCRQRQRLSRVAICTLPGVSACPFAHMGGVLHVFLAAAPCRSWASLKPTTPLEWLQIAPPLPHDPSPTCAVEPPFL